MLCSAQCRGAAAVGFITRKTVRVNARAWALAHHASNSAREQREASGARPPIQQGDAIRLRPTEQSRQLFAELAGGVYELRAVVARTLFLVDEDWFAGAAEELRRAAPPRSRRCR